MSRRKFIFLIVGAATVWPPAARAAARSISRIGILMAVSESDPEARAWLGAFNEGLQQPSYGWPEHPARLSLGGALRYGVATTRTW
jgi:hypothetical protein